MGFLTLAELERIAFEHGATVLTVLDVRSAENILYRNSAYLEKWQQAGHAAEMGYMLREPQLFRSLTSFLPNCRSVLSLAFNYFQDHSKHLDQWLTERGLCYQAQGAPIGYARVARYAWGRDYHRFLKRRMKGLVADVQKILGRPVNFRVFTDAAPILERALMVGGRGAGHIGRNSLFMKTRLGSFSLLSEILWDVDAREGLLPEVAVEDHSPGSGCGNCKRCVEICPTQALVGDGVLDARKCISYLTIEKKGAFDESQALALGDWIFGCDDCQEACPFNNRGNSGYVCEEFSPFSGTGPFISLTEVLQVGDQQQFLNSFSGTPIMRLGREGLLRNACAVIANQQNFSMTNELGRIFHEDDSPNVCYYTSQALWRLHRHGGIKDRQKIEKVLGGKRCLDEEVY